MSMFRRPSKPHLLQRGMTVFAAAAILWTSPGGRDANAQSSPQVRAELRAMLPANIREQGSISVAGDTAFGPVGLFTTKENPKDLIGFDIDLLEAVVDLLGIKARYEVTAFAGIIPGLLTGRWNMGVNTISDTPERQQVIDMLDFREAFSVLMVTKGNPLKIANIGDLCGKNVGMNPGTAQLAFLEDYSKANCKTPMNFLVLRSRADVFVSMEAGRADAHLIGLVSALGNVSSVFNPENFAKFELISPPGEKIARTLEGWAFPKNQSQLRDAISAALQETMRNGAYAKVLEKWGMSESAIDKPRLNGSGAKP